MNQQGKKEYYELMHKNPNNWKGVLYVNPRDPRIIVPKLNPLLGWTFNFGNVYAYIGIVVILLIIVGAKVFL